MTTYRPNIRRHPLDAHESAIIEDDGWPPAPEGVSAKAVVIGCCLGGAAWIGIFWWVLR